MIEPQPTLTAPLQSDTPVNRWKWKEVLLIIIVSVGIILGGALPISYLLSTEGGNLAGITINPLILNSALLIVETVGILLGIYLFGLRGNIQWREKIGFTPTTMNWLVRALVIAILFVPLLGLIAYLVQIALGQEYFNPQLPILAPGEFYLPGALLMLLVGGLAAPIAEEMLFRGVLYKWTRNRLNMAPAILLNGILFGLAHGEISLAVATGVMGMVLAWVYERSQSLWPSILIHVFNNTSKLLLLYLLLALGIEIQA